MENLKKLVNLLESLEKPIIGTDELVKYDTIIKSIFPDKNITYVDLPSFYLDSEGNVLLEYKDGANLVSIYSRSIREKEAIKVIKSKNLYILSIGKNEFGGSGVTIRLYETNLNKKKVTFTIAENIYEEFSNLSDKLAINKSKFVENKIMEFIEKNK